MTISPETVQALPGPRYQAIAEAFANAIGAGRLKADERLPPQRDLAWQLKVTVGTIGRAYELLIQRGLARGEVGRGTFVIGRPSYPAVTSASVQGERSLDLTSNTIARTPVAAELPPLLRECSEDPALVERLVTYPPILGHLDQRAACAAWLGGLGITTDVERLLITNGTQSALSVALHALTQPGAPLLVETLSYTGALNLARRLGLHLEPVAMDAEGLLPDALDSAARTSGARTLLVQPTVQNPTIAMMSLERRRAVIEVARRHDLTIIEDDVYGPLAPKPPEALAALAPERTIYVTGASKFLSPGLRFAVSSVPERLVGALAAAQAELSLATCPLGAELFMRAYHHGLVPRAVDEQRRELAARQELARRILTPALADPSLLVTCDHCLHVWLQLTGSWTASDLVLSLAREGVLTAPGDRFHAGRGMPPRAIRLSVSALRDRDELARALEIVADRLARGSMRAIAAV